MAPARATLGDCRRKLNPRICECTSRKIALQPGDPAVVEAIDGADELQLVFAHAVSDLGAALLQVRDGFEDVFFDAGGEEAGALQLGALLADALDGFAGVVDEAADVFGLAVAVDDGGDGAAVGVAEDD